MTLPKNTQHRYIPNAEEDVKEMLATIGVEGVPVLISDTCNG